MRILLDPLFRRGDAHLFQHLDALLHRVVLGDFLVGLQHLHHLRADCIDRVERRHRLLEDHRDLVAAHVPHLRVGGLGKILALEQDLAVLVNFTQAGRHQPQD